MVSTAALRRLKKQRQKETRGAKASQEGLEASNIHRNWVPLPKDVEIEYVDAPVIDTQDESILQEFSKVISRFTASNPIEEAEPEVDNDVSMVNSLDEEESAHPSISKKKLKRMNRMTLASLKQFSRHPEVVEWEDVTSKDPYLLVQLKAVRHSVPVPRHWSQKRKYLAGKRGYVKPPFELPAFIRETGITELRDTMRAQDSSKRLKVKAREKMHPKLGRISVDYERLYDAFFKYQTKPPLSMHGELYYEGKEFEGHQDKKPGFLSEELKNALGMATHLMPPPWLHSMQKYGPPPSYPHMKIPGLNAPIPEGAQWGYHPGGWGKPPVDNFMRDMPVKSEDPVQLMLLNPVERNLWGELEPEEELPAEEFEPEGPQELTLDEDQIDQYQPPSTVTEYRDRERNAEMVSDDSEIVQVRRNMRNNKDRYGDTGSQEVLTSPAKKRYPSISPLRIPRASTYPFSASSRTALEREPPEAPVKRNLSGTLCPRSSSQPNDYSSGPSSQRLVSSDYQLHKPVFSGLGERTKKPASLQRKHFPAGDYSKEALRLQTMQKQVASFKGESGNRNGDSSGSELEPDLNGRNLRFTT